MTKVEALARAQLIWGPGVSIDGGPARPSEKFRRLGEMQWEILVSPLVTGPGAVRRHALSARGVPVCHEDCAARASTLPPWVPS